MDDTADVLSAARNRIGERHNKRLSGRTHRVDTTDIGARHRDDDYCRVAECERQREVAKQRRENVRAYIIVRAADPLRTTFAVPSEYIFCVTLYRLVSTVALARRASPNNMRATHAACDTHSKQTLNV